MKHMGPWAGLGAPTPPGGRAASTAATCTWTCSSCLPVPTVAPHEVRTAILHLGGWGAQGGLGRLGGLDRRLPGNLLELLEAGPPGSRRFCRGYLRGSAGGTRSALASSAASFRARRIESMNADMLCLRVLFFAGLRTRLLSRFRRRVVQRTAGDCCRGKKAITWW